MEKPLPVRFLKDRTPMLATRSFSLTGLVDCVIVLDHGCTDEGVGRRRCLKGAEGSPAV